MLTIFDSQKYRTTVLVNHAKIGRSETLISEFLSFYWNFTLSKNKVGAYVIYVAYDSEAIEKFGNRLHTQMLRAIFKYSMADATHLNIEDSIRIASTPTEIRNYYYKRVMDGEIENVSIIIEDKKSA
ncbi:hypothetical protein [Pedobacter flavus]|uniref:Uncharacterized protein n=1 Tax=Pedobacter flavus TaxID=3113906 RepID=A0ABU7H1F1_9SPHI|nr:hypothetical protein [Pedobacter sp. VNH31]MEE1884371.1 hypothetical protein [Pedobacter sp. VNH31]